jgi:hypothetical protein
MKATFFVIGDAVRNHPEVVRNAIARGHQIGHHGYLHQLMNTFTEAQVVQEVYRWEQVFLARNIVPGKIPTYYRIRSGAQTSTTKRVIDSFGYTSVHWAILNSDSAGLTGDQIFEKMTQHFGDGSTVQSANLVPIIQMHDREPATVSSFARVAAYFKSVMPNAQFVTLEQCLGLPAYRDYPTRNVPTDPTCSGGRLARDNVTCCSNLCGVCGGIGNSSRYWLRISSHSIRGR